MVGIIRLHGVRHRLGEGLEFVPANLGLHRCDHVKAVAASRLYERDEARLLKALLDLKRRGDHLLP